MRVATNVAIKSRSKLTQKCCVGHRKYLRNNEACFRRTSKQASFYSRILRSLVYVGMESRRGYSAYRLRRESDARNRDRNLRVGMNHTYGYQDTVHILHRDVASLNLTHQLVIALLTDRTTDNLTNLWEQYVGTLNGLTALAETTLLPRLSSYRMPW